MRSSRLVGRDRELATVRRALTDARRAPRWPAPGRRRGGDRQDGARRARPRPAGPGRPARHGRSCRAMPLGPLVAAIRFHPEWPEIGPAAIERVGRGRPGGDAARILLGLHPPTDVASRVLGPAPQIVADGRADVLEVVCEVLVELARRRPAGARRGGSPGCRPCHPGGPCRDRRASRPRAASRDRRIPHRRDPARQRGPAPAGGAPQDGTVGRDRARPVGCRGDHRAGKSGARRPAGRHAGGAPRRSEPGPAALRRGARRRPAQR